MSRLLPLVRQSHVMAKHVTRASQSSTFTAPPLPSALPHLRPISRLSPPHVRLLHSTRILHARDNLAGSSGSGSGKSRKYSENEVQYLVNQARAERPRRSFAFKSAVVAAIALYAFIEYNGYKYMKARAFFDGILAGTAMSGVFTANLYWWKCHDCGTMNECEQSMEAPCKQCNSLAMENRADLSQPFIRGNAEDFDLSEGLATLADRAREEKQKR